MRTEKWNIDGRKRLAGKPGKKTHGFNGFSNSINGFDLSEYGMLRPVRNLIARSVNFRSSPHGRFLVRHAFYTNRIESLMKWIYEAEKYSHSRHPALFGTGSKGTESGRRKRPLDIRLLLDGQFLSHRRN